MGLPQMMIFTLFLLFAVQTRAQVQLQHQTNIIFKNITHILPYQDQILLVDSERIYTLNKSLHIESNITTCAERLGECVNVMKVFLLDKYKEKLITCGSGNSGHCQIRNTSKIVDITDESVGNVVSTEGSKPATAILTPDNNILIGATYGEGLSDTSSTSEYLSYLYALSTRLTESSQAVRVNKALILQLEKQANKALEDYLIYFKTAQRLENYTYLVTNQKQYVGSTDGYVSKIIRLCESDTTKLIETRPTFDTYVDMEIKCEKDGKKYNLIQDAVFVKYNEEFYFLGVFANTTDPENIDGGGGAVCATKVSQISQNIQTIWDRFRRCEGYNDDERYFPNAWKDVNSCNNGTESVSCDPLPSFKYVLGDIPLMLTPLYIHDDPEEYLTKIKGRNVEREIDEEKLAILVGSSRGKLIQFNFMGMDQDLEKYEEIDVHTGFPILDFYETGESEEIFVASQRKFVKYSETTCSEFSTCEATMAGRNPLCGWCIYEGKGTRKSQCSLQSHWLSALGKCVKLSLEPKGQLFSDQDKSVQITVDGHPGSTMPSDIYTCVYKTSSGEEIDRKTATGIFPRLACATPNRQSSAIILHLMVSRGGAKVLLSSNKYEYYNCSSYNSCGSCTANSYGICSWCTEMNACIQSAQQSSCSNKWTDMKNECPQLDMTDLQYVPNGFEQEVKLNTKNLNKNDGGSYFCVVGEIRFPASKRNNILVCNVTNNMVEGKKKEQQSIIALYQKSGKEVRLDDDFKAQVTVYRCDILGKDCSHCVSVNATRYQCKWCGLQKNCVFSGSDTCNSEECSAPTITEVDPNDGPYKGGTIVTIKGHDLGTTVNDVESVNLVGEACTLLKNDFSTTDDSDYRNEVPTSVVCRSNSLGQDRWEQFLNSRGNATITVNGKTSAKENGFAYKVANITSIYPLNGPKGGGTLVTMYGTNLGIGNRNIDIFYNSDPNRFKECRVVTRPVDNSTIQCRTGKLEKDMDSLILFMSGLENKISESSLHFGILDNPVVSSIIPKLAILSGGTTLSVAGENLENAHTKQIKLNYAGIESVSECATLSQQQLECKVPAAPEQLQSDTNSINSNSDNMEENFSEVPLYLILDGIIHGFTLKYFLDPEFDLLNEDGGTIIFKAGTEKLILKGSRLNLAAKENDVRITVGIEECFVVKFEEKLVECIPPKEAPTPGISGSNFAEVNVTVGNLRKTLGYLDYTKDVVETVQYIAIIAGVSAATLVLFIIIGGFVLATRYKRMNKKAQQLTGKLEALEMKIKSMEEQDVGTGVESESSKDVYDYITPCDENISSDEQLQRTGHDNGYEIPRSPYEHLRSNDDGNRAYERLGRAGEQ